MSSASDNQASDVWCEDHANEVPSDQKLVRLAPSKSVSGPDQYQDQDEAAHQRSLVPE